MLTYQYRKLQTKISGILLQCGFTLAIPLLLFFLIAPAAQVSAHSHTKPVISNLSMQVEMGFQSTYRDNYWVPVIIHINNNGAAFQGKLSIKVFTGSPRTRIIGNISPWSFEQPVTIAARAQEQVTINAPFYLSNFMPLGFIATLFDQQGKTVATQTTGTGFAIRPGDLFIGILSDADTNFNALNSVDLPHQSDSLTISMLNASTFPDNSVLLKNFDIIILDDFHSSTLSTTQLMTLQTWVNQGGILIEAGGVNWQQTIVPLPASLLPVQVNTLQTLPAGTKLLPVDSSLIATNITITAPDALAPPSISASTGALSNPESQILLATGTTPLIVQSQQGQGVVCYVAFDLGQNPLANWTGIKALWATLLLHTLGDKILVATDSSIDYENDPGQLLTQGGIVRMLIPDKLLEPGLVLLLLLFYILMLGPIRVLIVRGLKQPRQWAWHIVLITILVFSLLSYGVATSQKGAWLTDNTISLIQLNEGGSTAHILTYHGLLTPDQGTIVLQMANKSVALPLSSPLEAKTPLPGPKNDIPASVTTENNQTAVTLPGGQRWDYHPLLSERDAHLSGAITPHLTIHSNRISGTITNMLATALSDVYMLFPNYFVRVGHIEAGATQQIDLPLHYTPLNRQTLADAMAKDGGLTTPYFPYTDSGQTQNDFQRHMALLSALNGAGMSIIPCSGACNQNALVQQNTITLASAPVNDNNANTSYDSLLLPGTSATLIGWTDQQIDGTDTMTINGAHPGGKHEGFVQMPISPAIDSLADIPAGFVTGHTIDLQGSQAQFLLPGIYSLSSASMLFEFTLAGAIKVEHANVDIKIPVQWEQLSGQLLTGKSIQTHLYNWHTGLWDTVPELQGIVTVADPTSYTGIGQQILLEITNPDNTPGPLIFGKPSLIFLNVST
ncbi:MAG: hypothetical protein H0V70_22195 [Ktedonobacteraceae bacterium]|nr:hypothetical protein [Ktedonobacteraceae bacterium]